MALGTILAMYEYTIRSCSTTAHVNADAHSWLPLTEIAAIVEKPPGLVSTIGHLQELLVNVDHICS